MLASRRPAPGHPAAGVVRCARCARFGSGGWRVAPALLTLALCGGAQGQAGFVPLADLPGGASNSQAFGVSADGRVVVGLGSISGEVRAVRWVEGGAPESLGNIPDGFGTLANGVSADGGVVVGTGFTATGFMAFRWEDGAFELLGDLAGGAVSSFGSSVSGDGRVVVGDSSSTMSPEAYRWTASEGMVGLGDFAGGAAMSAAMDVSADGSVLVGFGASANGFEAFRWTASEGLVALGDLPGGGHFAQGVGVSSGGDFVVGRSLSGSGQEAFLWSAGAGLQGLGDLEGGRFESIANGVTEDGSLIVGRGTSAAGAEALVWTASTGTMRLADYLTDEAGLDLMGWRLLEATGVSADGSVIVGFGLAPGAGQQAWMARLREAAPCPEDAFVDLWPPNHAWASIDIAQAAGVEGSVAVAGVTSDEAVNGLGDGATLLDARVEGGVVRVRAERAGDGDGRVYAVRYRVEGRDCEGSVFVRVPLEEGEEAIDSGQSFDATAPAQMGDINGDGRIDGADLGRLLGEWGRHGQGRDLNLPDSDLDGDARVLGADLRMLLEAWRPGPARRSAPRRVGGEGLRKRGPARVRGR